MGAADSAKKRLRAKPAGEPDPVWLSTGSALLNLACAGRPDGGLRTGCVYRFVGDSSSGKTMAALTCLAEAANDPRFAGHRLVAADAENGMILDIRGMFGRKLADRLEVVRPQYLDDFYGWLDGETRDKGARPLVLVLDSMDALEPREQEEKRREKTRNPEAAGSYGTAKAKMNSSNLGWVSARMRDQGGVFVVISQSRDRIGFGSQFDPQTSSGGRSLRFYATMELWFKVREALKTKSKVKGKQRDQGVLARVTAKKNRQTGRVPSVDLPIYWSHGIDDLGACVRYLVSEGHWPEDRGAVNAPEFDFSGKPDALIRLIEEGGRETELHLLVAEVWAEIEAACRVERKKKYE